MRPDVTDDEAINGSRSRDGDGDEDDVGQLGLLAAQLSALVFISVLGTFANALVFAVFYRRPSLRTISNRSVSRHLAPFARTSKEARNDACPPDFVPVPSQRFTGKPAN